MFNQMMRNIEYGLMVAVSTMIAGKKVCSVCQKEVSYYKPYGIKLRMNAECPYCKAAERDRIEVLYYRSQKNILGGGGRQSQVLHFAPEKCQYRYFTQTMHLRENYWRVDIDPSNRMCRQIVDITNIGFENNSFDLIIYNHVLEHVEKVNKAIRELSRVLSEEGYAIITVPVDEKHFTLESPSINTDILRIKYYGAANHVRMFGKDFKKILWEFGLEAKRIPAKLFLDKQSIREAGLKINEYFWLCKKLDKLDS